MTLPAFGGIAAISLLQGALVALPKRNALRRLARLRSPAWAVVLPGSIVIGTFGIQALPPAATGLVVLAGIATPLLSGVAALWVLRGPRAAGLAVIPALLVVATVFRGVTGEVSAGILTGLGCSTLGVALVRLIPRQFILMAVLGMCAIDVALLAIGAGQPAAALMAQAEAHVHRPVFAHTMISGISIDYPDLVLAAVLGGVIAGRRAQLGTALLVTILATAYGMLLPAVHTLPATVPPAFVFSVLRRIATGAGLGLPRWAGRATQSGETWAGCRPARVSDEGCLAEPSDQPRPSQGAPHRDTRQPKCSRRTLCPMSSLRRAAPETAAADRQGRG
jgi:hypothetical protein